MQITNFVFNYHNCAVPNIFRSNFSVNNQIHHRNTRASNKLHDAVCIKLDLSLTYVFTVLKFKDFSYGILWDLRVHLQILDVLSGLNKFHIKGP